MPRDAPIPGGIALPRLPYSPVIRSGDHVFTAGQVAHDEDGAIVAGGIAEQTTQVLGNVRACLAAAGCDLDDVQKVNVYLADLADFEAFNAVYREAFTAPYPARTTVQVGLPPGILIEVEAVARLASR
jgi:2-iminobutanoate/2-iminopropanoate deaminase